MTGMQDDAFLTAFEQDGFCRLPGLLPADELSRIQSFIDSLLVADTVPGKAISDGPGRKVVTNIGRLLSWNNPALLEILALPQIMRVASAICGPELFTVQEFAVIKHGGDDTPVLWHQDMVSRRSAPCVAMGLYLDDANTGDGALHFVPGSHHSDASICDLAQQPSVEVPAKAGDVIIHDMMVAHSSGLMKSNRIRRVIYLEFLSVELALQEQIYPAEMIANRQRLLFAARRYRRATVPGGSCFKPRMRDPAPRDRKLTVGKVLADVHETSVHPRPANYCFDVPPAGVD